MDNNRLTAKDVEALLLEHVENLPEDEDYYGDGWDFWAEVAGGYANSKTVDVLGLGDVKVWENDFGGIETNVSHLMFQIGDRVFRKEGLWVSHCGMYWDGPFSEVKPVQRVITDYEAVKE